MASIDSKKMEWEDKYKSKSEKADEEKGVITRVDIDTEPEAIKELYAIVNELVEKVNVIYDGCIESFKIKNNPYDKK